MPERRQIQPGDTYERDGENVFIYTVGPWLTSIHASSVGLTTLKTSDVAEWAAEATLKYVRYGHPVDDASVINEHQPAGLGE